MAWRIEVRPTDWIYKVTEATTDFKPCPQESQLKGLEPS